MIRPMPIAATNMTSLILLLRKTANMTGLFRREGQQVTEDPFDRCHSCASDASYRGSGDHGNQGMGIVQAGKMYMYCTVYTIFIF